MNSSDIAILVFIVSAIFVYTRWAKQKNNPSVSRNHSSIPEEQLQDFPYAVQNHFLSPAELSFYQVLRGVVEDRAVVCPKVGLGDVFWVEVKDKSQFRAYRNRIDRKHVDFMLCDPMTMQPVLGIELDDKSHERADRQERDAFVDSVFEAAKLPLLHVPAKRDYAAAELGLQVAPYLKSKPQPIQAASSQQISANPVPVSPTPRCPRCGSLMVVRTIKNGANAGTQFWGCSTYPTCRGMISIPQA